MLAWWDSVSELRELPLAAFVLPAILLSASLTLWVRFGARCWEGQSILPYEPRRPVPWTVVDLIWLFVVFFAANSVFYYLYIGEPGGEGSQLTPYLLIVDSVSKLTVLAAALIGLRALHGTTPADWGLVAPRGSDWLIGAIAVAAFLPPVYLLNFLMTLIQPVQHPLLVALQESSDPLLRILVFFSAGILAPVWEELFFRVLLQGWLEKVMLQRHEPAPDEAVVHELSPGDGTSDEYGVSSGAPHGWWAPIVVSAIIFAAVHFDFEKPRLDVLPLFVFACGLGYVYQRTHRVWPSMMMHLALNSCSLVMLFAGKPAG